MARNKKRLDPRADVRREDEILELEQKCKELQQRAREAMAELEQRFGRHAAAQVRQHFETLDKRRRKNQAIDLREIAIVFLAQLSPDESHRRLAHQAYKARHDLAWLELLTQLRTIEGLPPIARSSEVRTWVRHLISYSEEAQRQGGIELRINELDTMMPELRRREKNEERQAEAHELELKVCALARRSPRPLDKTIAFEVGVTPARVSQILKKYRMQKRSARKS